MANDVFCRRWRPLLPRGCQTKASIRSPFPFLRITKLVFMSPQAMIMPLLRYERLEKSTLVLALTRVSRLYVP